MCFLANAKMLLPVKLSATSIGELQLSCPIETICNILDQASHAAVVLPMSELMLLLARLNSTALSKYNAVGTL